MNAWSVILGAIVTGILTYRVVPWIISHVDAKVRESLVDREESTVPRPPGGDIVGYIDCAIFFASFVFMGVLLAAAWLVFKTAATWKIWETMKDVTYSDVVVKYRSTVIGTGANLVAALIGAGIAYLP